MAVAPKPPAGSLYGGLTPAQYVASLYAPQRAALSQQAQARLAAFQSLISGALAQTQNDIHNSDAPYVNAIQSTNDLARTSAANLAAANPNDQTQAMLRAIGAPASQQAQVGAQNANTFTGGAGVLGYTGGVIPSTQMAQDAQARATYLSSLPGMIALTGLRGVSSLGSLASKDQLSLNQMENSDRLKAISDNAASISKAQSTAFNQRATTARNRLAADRLNSENFWRQNTYNLDVTKADWQQANADRTYGLSYQRYILAEKKAAAAAAKSGGVSPSVASHAYTDAQFAYNGTPPKYTLGPNGQRVLVQGTGPGTQLTYQQTVRMLVAKYPALGASGAIRLANNFFQNGEGGRPLSAGEAHTRTAEAGSLRMDSPSTAAGGFIPNGARYSVGRADQGRDFQTDPGGPIVAPGDGVVVAVKSDPGGFGPSYPVVHFTTGPYAGKTLYIGHTLSTLAAGTSFRAGQVLSRTGTTPIGNASVPGWAEIGYANVNGLPGAFGQPTPFGG